MLLLPLLDATITYFLLQTIENGDGACLPSVQLTDVEEGEDGVDEVVLNVDKECEK